MVARTRTVGQLRSPLLAECAALLLQSLRRAVEVSAVQRRRHICLSEKALVLAAPSPGLEAIAEAPREHFIAPPLSTGPRRHRAFVTARVVLVHQEPSRGYILTLWQPAAKCTLLAPEQPPALLQVA